MGIFTRLFGEKENEGTSEGGDGASASPGEVAANMQPQPEPDAEPELPAVRGTPVPRPPAAPEPAAAADRTADDEGQDEESSARSRSMLLSPTPRLVGGIKVAPSKPRDAARGGDKPRAPTPPKPAAAKPAAAREAPQFQPRKPAKTQASPKPERPATTPGLPPVDKPAFTVNKPPRKPARKAASREKTRLGAGAIPVGKGKQRQRKSSISDAFEAIVSGDEDAASEGVSTQADRAEIQRVFDELAATHVDQVRNVMLELEVGDVVCSWIENSKPALVSLRRMAEQMELRELCSALDEFCAAIDEAVDSGQAKVVGERKAELQRRYQKLIELIPQAFALDGERDRREPIIVQSLLRQVAGVEKLTIDKLFAVGLDRLTALMKSNGGDIAAAAGIDLEVAERIAERFHTYREAVPSAVAARDAETERRELAELVARLKKHHDEYESAAAGWSAECLERKREARKRREAVFLEVRVALARLGETERLEHIEKRPFGQRIAEVEKYLDEARAQALASRHANPAAAKTQTVGT